MTQGSLRKYDHGNFKKFIFQAYEKYCVGKWKDVCSLLRSVASAWLMWEIFQVLAGLVEFRDRVNLEMILNSDQIFLGFTTKKKEKKNLNRKLQNVFFCRLCVCQLLQVFEFLKDSQTGKLSRLIWWKSE